MKHPTLDRRHIYPHLNHSDTRPAGLAVTSSYCLLIQSSSLPHSFHLLSTSCHFVWTFTTSIRSTLSNVTTHHSANLLLASFTCMLFLSTHPILRVQPRCLHFTSQCTYHLYTYTYFSSLRSTCATTYLSSSLQAYYSFYTPVIVFPCLSVYHSIRPFRTTETSLPRFGAPRPKCVAHDQACSNGAQLTSVLSVPPPLCPILCL